MGKFHADILYLDLVSTCEPSDLWFLWFFHKSLIYIDIKYKSLLWQKEQKIKQIFVKLCVTRLDGDWEDWLEISYLYIIEQLFYSCYICQVLVHL